MEVTVRRIKAPFLSEGVNQNGNTLLIDGSKDAGGEDGGFRPMELLLAGIAGCSSIDLALILQKQRQPLEGYEIKVTGDREKVEEVNPFSKIHLHFTLFGNLDEKKVKRAVDLAVTKYCSVGVMLAKTAKISYSYEISDSESV